MWRFARDDNVRGLQKVMNKFNVNLDDLNEDGETATFLAAENAADNALGVLIAGGADMNITSCVCDMTPCYIAAEEGHASTISLLVSAGADVDKATTDDGTTPCHAAAREGHTDALRALLNAGADMDAVMDSGQTPLITAAEKRQLDTLRLLVDAGANLNKAGTPRLPVGTPCFIAAQGGDVEALTILIAAKADVNKALTIVEFGGDVSPLAAACGYTASFACVRLLVTHSASFIAPRGYVTHLKQRHHPAHSYVEDSRKWTPMHAAADARDLATLIDLIDRGFDPRTPVAARREDMRTPLGIAQSGSYPTSLPVDQRCVDVLARALSRRVQWSVAAHWLCPKDVRVAVRSRALLQLVLPSGRVSQDGGKGPDALCPDVWRVIFSFLIDGKMDVCERDPRACWCCGATSGARKCSGCHIARFCNDKCQRWAWERDHKAECTNRQASLRWKFLENAVKLFRD